MRDIYSGHNSEKEKKNKYGEHLIIVIIMGFLLDFACRLHKMTNDFAFMVCFAHLWRYQWICFDQTYLESGEFVYACVWVYCTVYTRLYV